MEFLDARIRKEAEALDTLDAGEAREMEMHAEDLQVEADAMEIGIVDLTAEHHAHDEDFVWAFELGSDEELRQDVRVRNRDHELAARHQHAMPFRQGRREIGERDVLEHVAGIKRFDRVNAELREILASADVVDFGPRDEVECLPAWWARSGSDQQLQLDPREKRKSLSEAA